ncbi:hypothetical protein MKW98_018703 [Papaver atlanticum]|uniref:Uncharacterized protein n=1 Tax=Papaver atlanticum TaxID=357466 RepID=A0AAD4XQR3_9MAGN|nr:hypothetical protein MKW98_018703 [Papaver atlanticum]
MGGSGQFTPPYYDAQDMILAEDGNNDERRSPTGGEVFGTEQEVSIEVVEIIADSVIKKVESGRSLSRSWGGCCIYRLHEKFHKMSESYVPEVVSIGPFHCKKENLKSTEECKLLYMHDLLCRTAEKKYKDVTEINNDDVNKSEEIEDVRIPSNEKREKIEELVRKYSPSGTATSNRWLIPLMYCVEAIKKIKSKACECYSEPIMLKNEEFVEMMVIDGLFIIELLQRCAMKRKNNVKDDPLLGKLWVLSSLTRDLLLLENQLPMIVLRCLFNLTSLEDELEGKSLNMLVLGFFNHLMPKDKEVLLMQSIKHNHESKHLLNLIAKTFHPPPVAKKAQSRWKFLQIATKMKPAKPINSIKPDNSSWNLFSRSVRAKLNQAGFSKFIRGSFTSATHSSRPLADVENTAYASSWKYIPNATELKRAGVKFRKGSTEGSVLNIEFNDGVLVIPPIKIQDKTDLLFRNIIAYEQCSDGRHMYMTSYAFLMDSLIDSAQDVEMLRNKGIITNILGSDEDVANLFNKLCCELIIDNFYYSRLRDQVNDYYKKRRHFWKGIVKRDYCNNPCQVLSLVAGFFLIVLTFTGAVFAILSFFVHKS